MMTKIKTSLTKERGRVADRPQPPVDAPQLRPFPLNLSCLHHALTASTGDFPASNARMKSRPCRSSSLNRSCAIS